MYSSQHQTQPTPMQYNYKVFSYDESHCHQMAMQKGAQNVELNRSMEKPSGIPSGMVMIDQAQLMELLAAKQILDAQRAAAAKPGFNSALFISPPRMSKENRTQCSSASNTSADYGEVEPLKVQRPTVSFSAIPSSQSSSNHFDCDTKSEHSVEDQTQGQMLDDDLMRIIDDVCAETDEQNVESFELSKINENSKGSLNKSGSSIDSLIQNFQSMEIKQLDASRPEQFKSIFSQDPVWTAPPTVNNIVINNYNGFVPQAQEYKPFFPNMQQLVQPQPIFSDATLMSQMQPQDFNRYEQYSTRSNSSDSQGSCDDAKHFHTPAHKRGDFKFPEGGWECSKC